MLYALDHVPITIPRIDDPASSSGLRSLEEECILYACMHTLLLVWNSILSGDLESHANQTAVARNKGRSLKAFNYTAASAEKFLFASGVR